jgi:hypothetical protein
MKMLKGKVRMTPMLYGKNYKNHPHLRLCFLFGDDVKGFRLTGGVRSSCAEFLQGETYDVDVEFFTVIDDAYSKLKPILKKGMRLAICEGRKIVGDAQLLDFKYVG